MESQAGKHTITSQELALRAAAFKADIAKATLVTRRGERRFVTLVKSRFDAGYQVWEGTPKAMRCLSGSAQLHRAGAERVAANVARTAIERGARVVASAIGSIVASPSPPVPVGAIIQGPECGPELLHCAL